jgi:hypothetical protein
MSRWILATLLAVSALVNLVVLAKFSETRRDVEELRRRVRVAPAAAPGVARDSAPVPIPAYEPSIPAPLAGATQPARDRVTGAALPSPSSWLSDLDRCEAFWAALERVERHRETLGDDYERSVMELTAGFLGVDAATLGTVARQVRAECDAAETDEAYELARARLTSLLQPSVQRTHRFFVARLDDWLSTTRQGGLPLSGAVFELEPDK